MTIEFLTKMNGKDFDDYDTNFKIISPIKLKWIAKIVANSQQISDIIAEVPDQELNVRIEKEVPVGKDGFDFVEEDIIIKLSEVKVEYLRENMSDSRAIGLMPVKISNYKKQWVVEFTTGSL